MKSARWSALIFATFLSALPLSAAGPDRVWRRIAPAPCCAAPIAFAATRDFLYAGATGLFRMDLHQPGPWSPLTLITNLVYSIAVAPSDPATVYAIALGGPGPLRGLQSPTLFRSKDAGASWSQLLTSIDSVVVDPFLSTTVYAGASPTYEFFNEGFFRSDDDGNHWTVSKNGFPSCPPPGTAPCGVSVGSIVVNHTLPTVLYAVSGGIFRSTDGGSSWDLIRSRTGFISFYGLFLDEGLPDTLYATTVMDSRPLSFGVLRTTDGGSTWTFLAVPGFTVTSVFAVDPVSHSLFAGTDAGVLRSDDLGEQWTPFGEGLTGLPVSSLAVGPGDDLYAGTTDGVFVISTSILARADTHRPPARTLPFR